MGSGRKDLKWRNNVFAIQGQSNARFAEEQIQDAEIAQTELLGLLGTEDQVAGNLVSPEVAAYGRTLRYDPSYGGAVLGDKKKDNPYSRDLDLAEAKGIIRGEYDDKKAGKKAWKSAKKEGLSGIGGIAAGILVEDVNELMMQAREAAEAGDLDGAAALKAQAEDMFENSFLFEGQEGAMMREAFGWEDDPTLKAAAAASNPTAQAIGGQLKEATELQDPESETYREHYETLTEDPLRAIEAGRESANRVIDMAVSGLRRQARDLGLSRGAGRNPQEMLAVLSRVDDMASNERAQVISESARQSAAIMGAARQHLQQYADVYQTNAAQVVRDYAQGAPGVRDYFTQSLTAMQMAMQQYNLALAGQEMQRLIQKDYLNKWEQIADDQITQGYVGMGLDIGSGLAGAGLTFLGGMGGGSGGAS